MSAKKIAVPPHADVPFCAAYALELLDELGEGLERDYAVASVLVDRLKPGEDEIGDACAYSLAQVLEERIADMHMFHMLREQLVQAVRA